MASAPTSEPTAWASKEKVILGCIAFVIWWVLAVFPAVPFMPIGRTAGSLVGASLMVVFQVISPTAAFAAVDLSILGLLFGTMVISVYLERADLFKYLGYVLSWKTLGGKDLLCRLSLLAAISSALFTNDTTCVVLTGFVLQLCKSKNLSPQPFLLALACSSNIGSAATPIGNPQNLVIAVQSGLGFGKFLVGVLPAVVVGLVVNTIMILVVFWRSLSRSSIPGGVTLEILHQCAGNSGLPNGHVRENIPDKDAECVGLDHLAKDGVPTERCGHVGVEIAHEENIPDEDAECRTGPPCDNWGATGRRGAKRRREWANPFKSEILELGESCREQLEGRPDPKDQREVIDSGSLQGASSTRHQGSDRKISILVLHDPEPHLDDLDESSSIRSSSHQHRDDLMEDIGGDPAHSTSRSNDRKMSLIICNLFKKVPQKSRRRIWKTCVYLVAIGMLAALLAGLSLPWSAITAAVVLMVLDFSDANPNLDKVTYSLLVFFSGMFITVEGFNLTGVPGKLWSAVEPHSQINTVSGIAILSLVVTVLSNVASNVPTVLLLGPRVAASAAATPGVSVAKAWLILAWVSTVAGNLTLVGSAANLIVCEQARRVPIGKYNLSFWKHLRFGFISTLIVITVGLPLIRG